ncbi:Retrovirus-related Pol poly from transposon [Paramuricea clavata]|uniref:Retrovirus-related Pol poly from transposon n=1 Tax=Paramuricea clavata TaxID=317549 RepID=A0A7D9JJY2_PARCT|nr:Retrovirus-related Pol poly from transposon [Paramuricea clavata]
MVDYYSNFIEVARITSTISRSIIKELKAMFARYRVPDVLVMDNGPQFMSAEFAVFAKALGFDHITLSLHHPQLNGKAKNAVKTVKQLFEKCKESGQSEFLALLDWRNTPTERVGTSPDQQVMRQCCKTLVPIAGTLLKPQSNPEEDAQAIIGMKKRQ